MNDEMDGFQPSQKAKSLREGGWAADGRARQSIRSSTDSFFAEVFGEHASVSSAWLWCLLTTLASNEWRLCLFFS